MCPVYACRLQANDICSQIELIGVDWKEVVTEGHGLSGGYKGFMKRAMNKANERSARRHTQIPVDLHVISCVRLVEACSSVNGPETGARGKDPLSETDSMRALINVIKKEEITVTVDIASKVQASALLARPS